MAETVASLGIQIVADDRASKTLLDVERNLQQTGQATGTLSTNLEKLGSITRLASGANDGLAHSLQPVTAATKAQGQAVEELSATTVLKGGLIVGALLAVGTAAVKMAAQGVGAAADLEHSVASISTIKPDIDTSAVFKSLNNLQTQVPQTAKQLGDSLYDVFSSIDNVTEAQGLKLVETFAKGAVAAQSDAKTFGTAISGVLNAYKLDVDQAAKVSDVFFNTVNRGVVTGAQLAAGLGPAIAAAKALGVSYEEAFALIVGATKEGGDAAQNINNITNLLAKLNVQDATRDLNALGVATQTAAGALRSPIAVLTDLKAKLDGMTEAARATVLLQIFPDLQARQGAQVVMSQLATVNAALAENRTATNSTADAYAKMSVTAIEQGKLLQNTWTALLTDLSVVTLPALVGALGVAGGAVRAMREVFEEMQPAVEAASAAVQTKTTEMHHDLDTLTTYADTNARPKWEAFWRAATGADFPMRELPAPPPTTAQQAGAAGLGPTQPQYVPGVTPAPLEQTRSPFGGVGAGHLSPEESGLGPLGNIRGQFENMLQDMEESNAAHATAMADRLAEDYSAQLLRRKPAMHDAGVALGDAVAEGMTEATAAAEPVARSAALVARDLEEARNRQKIADLGGAVAIREHTEALHLDEIAQLGGAVAIRDHTEGLAREHDAALGGALSIREHAEALAREHEAALGGALAIREHDEALARTKEAALGGALAIREHVEALDREKEANLGGALAIFQHTQAREADTRTALVASGVADQEIAKRTALATATRDFQAAVQTMTAAQQDYYRAVAAVLGEEEALNRARAAGVGVAPGGGGSAYNPFGVGAAMGTGLAAGMQSQRAGVAAAARDLANTAVGAAQDALGIQSPSTVAAQQIGVPLAQGIAAGVTQAGGAIAEAVNAQIDEAVASAPTEGINQRIQQALSAIPQPQPTTLAPPLQQVAEQTAQAYRQAAEAVQAGLAHVAQANEQLRATAEANIYGAPLPGGQGQQANANDVTAAVRSLNATNDALAKSYRDEATAQAAAYRARETWLNAQAADNESQANIRRQTAEGVRAQARALPENQPTLQRLEDILAAIREQGSAAVGSAVISAALTAGREAGNNYGFQASLEAEAAFRRANPDYRQPEPAGWGNLGAPGFASNATGPGIDLTGLFQRPAPPPRTFPNGGVPTAAEGGSSRTGLDALIEAANAAGGGSSGAASFDVGSIHSVMDGWNQLKTIPRDANDIAAAVGGIGTAAQGSGTALVDMGGVFVRTLAEPIRTADMLAVAMVNVGTESAQAAAQAQQAWGTALRANQNIVAGLNTGTGLTYGQIYGGTATGSGSGQGSGTPFVPFNAYGMPIVSPLTGGSLRGYERGGVLPEDMWARGRSGQDYLLHKNETVVPAGGGGTTNFTIVVQAGLGASELLNQRAYWEPVVDKQIRPLLQKRGYL